jgi:cytochrome P450
MHFHAERYLSRDQQDEKTRSPDAPLFRAICDSSLPPSEKAARRIAHEAVVVIAAGSETTSRVLSITLYHILSNPDVLERLQREIMTVMPDAAVIPSPKAVEELPYLVFLSFQARLLFSAANPDP